MILSLYFNHFKYICIFYASYQKFAICPIVSEYCVFIRVSLSKFRNPIDQPNLAQSSQSAQPDANGKISICSWQQHRAAPSS